MHFWRQQVEIERAGKIVATGHVDSKMYVLHISHVILTSSEGKGDAKDQNDDIGKKDKVEVEINDQKVNVELLLSNLNQEPKVERRKKQIVKKNRLYAFWHACLTHTNPQKMKKLNDHVNGLDIFIIPTDHGLNCMI